MGQDRTKVTIDDFMPAPLYYVYRKRHTVFVIKFSCFVYGSYVPIRLPRVVKCVTSGDVASGVAKCDLQSIWNQARIQKCGTRGSSAEGRRRRRRRRWGMERGYPLPSGGGVWGGAVSPPQKSFGIFSFEMMHFDAFWSTF